MTIRFKAMLEMIGFIVVGIIIAVFTLGSYGHRKNMKDKNK